MRRQLVGIWAGVVLGSVAAGAGYWFLACTLFLLKDDILTFRDVAPHLLFTAVFYGAGAVVGGVIAKVRLDKPPLERKRETL